MYRVPRNPRNPKPPRSSISRGILGTAEGLCEASAVVPSAFFWYHIGEQMVNEVTNPTPCK